MGDEREGDGNRVSKGALGRQTDTQPTGALVTSSTSLVLLCKLCRITFNLRRWRGGEEIMRCRFIQAITWLSRSQSDAEIQYRVSSSSYAFFFFISLTSALGILLLPLQYLQNFNGFFPFFTLTEAAAASSSFIEGVLLHKEEDKERSVCVSVAFATLSMYHTTVCTYYNTSMA